MSSSSLGNDSRVPDLTGSPRRLTVRDAMIISVTVLVALLDLLFVFLGLFLSVALALLFAYTLAVSIILKWPPRTRVIDSPTDLLSTDRGIDLAVVRPEQQTLSTPFLIVLCSAALLLYMSLLFQADRDYRSRFFAEQAILSSGQARVLVIYPRTLQFDTPDVRGLPLTVQLALSITPGTLPQTASLPTSTAFLSPTASLTPTTPPTSTTPLTFPKSLQFTLAPTSTVVLSYTIAPEQGDPLQFSDADGKTITPPFDLTVVGGTVVRRTLYVRPAPHPEVAGRTIVITGTVTGPGGAARPLQPDKQQVTLTIETINEARVRLLTARLLGDFALPFGLAAAVIGWTLDARQMDRDEKERVERKKEQEERERERKKEREGMEKAQQEQQRARITRVRQMLVSDPVRAIFEARDLENEEPNWGMSLSEDFQDLRTTRDQRKTRVVAEQLLRQAGEYYVAGNDIAGDETLHAIEILFKEQPLTKSATTLSNISSLEIERDLKSLSIQVSAARTVLRFKPSSSIEDQACISIAVPTALALWDEYTEEARGVAVRLIRHVLNVYDGIADADRKKMFERRFVTEIRVQNQLRPGWHVLRDPRLLEHSLLKDDQDLSIYVYSWPPQWPQRRQSFPTAESVDPRVANWLQRNNLIWEDLDTRSTELGKLLRIFLPPNEWDETIAAPTPVVVTDVIIEHTAVIAGMIYDDRKQQKFLVELSLPPAEMETKTDAITLLRAIAHAVSDVWLRLLRADPGIFLELPQPDRVVLAQMLVWACGSWGAFSSRLQRPEAGKHGQKLGAEGQTVLQQVNMALGSDHRVAAPQYGEMLIWLSIRPPGLYDTYLLVDCHDRRPIVGEQTLRLLDLADKLADGHVYIKMFATKPPPEAALANIRVIHLTWPAESLHTMLDSLIYEASGHMVSKVEELVDPLPSDWQPPVDALIAQAGGSFGRLIDLFKTAIRDHATHGPGASSGV